MSELAFPRRFSARLGRAAGFGRLPRPGILAAAFVAGLALVLAYQASIALDLTEQPGFLGAAEGRSAVLAYWVLVAFVGGTALLVPAGLVWTAPAIGIAAFASTALAVGVAGGEAPDLLVALATIACCWGLGLGVLRLAGLGATPLAALPCVPVSLGIGILALTVFLLGRLGLIGWWSVGGPTLAGALVAAGVLAAGSRAQLGRVRTWLPRSRTKAALLGMLFVHGAVALVWTAAPEIQYDALYGKAWLPEHWADTGQIETLLTHPVLSLVGVAELLAIPGHTLEAESVGRYLQLAAGILIVWTLWRVGEGFARGLGAGLAVVFAATPHVVWQASTAFDDLLLALVTLGAALVVLHTPAVGERWLASAIVVGLATGTCAAAKAHLAPFALVIAVGWALGQRPLGSAPRRLAGVTLGGLLSAGLYPLFRYFDTGNPVFPQLNGIFKSEHFPPENVSWNLPFLKEHGLGDLVRVPYDAVTEPVRLNEAVPDGVMGILVVAFFVVLALGWRLPGRGRILWLGIVATFAVWWLSLRYLRYLLPYGAVSLILLAPYLARLGARTTAVRRELFFGLTAVFVALVFFPSSVATFWNIGERVPFKAAFGREAEAAYVARSVPGVRAIEAFNRLAPDDAVVAGDLYQRSLLDGERNLSPFFEVWMRRGLEPSPALTGEELRDRLLDANVGWLALADDHRRPNALPKPYDDVVERHSRLVFADNNYELYRVGAAPSRAEPVPLCDGAFRGGRNCWGAALDSAAGLTAAEMLAAVAQSVPVCAGATYEVVARAPAAAEPMRIVLAFAQPQPGAGYSWIDTRPGEAAPLRGTAPPGSTSATIQLQPLGPKAALTSVSFVRLAGPKRC